MHSDHIKKIITAGLAIATITGGGVVYNSSVAMAETIPQKENPQEVVESKSDKNKPIVSGDVTTKENVTIDKQGVTVGDKGIITVKDGSITFPASSNNIIEHKEEKRNLDSINNVRSTTSRRSLPVISSENPDVSIDILEIDEDSNKANCLITVRNQKPNKKIKVDLKLYEHHRFQRWTHTTNKSFNLTTNDQGEASDDFSFDTYTEASINPGSLIYNADTVIEQLPSEEHNTDPSIDPSTDPSTEHNTDPSPISKDPDDTKDKIIQFKDQNFKNALLACMKDQGLIADDATEINEQQALKLVNSDGSSVYKRLINEKIKDISGIKYFKNLTSLNLSRNHISDFSELSELHNLTDLDISFNNIVNSDLSTPDSSSQGKDKPKGIPINDNISNTLINLPNSIINLKANHINLSDLTWIKHMTNLEQLDVSFNNLKSIHIKDLQLDSLIKLNAAVNQITDISSISDLHNLKELDLIDNHIEGLSALQNLSKLQILQLGKNNISAISSLQQLETLQKLDLSNNNISSIFPLKQLKNLQKLDLSHNNVSDINLISDLISNGKLADINLSENHINNIRNLKGVSDKHDIDLYMERQTLPTYDFKGQDISLNDIINPSESTCWADVRLTNEDYDYYSPDPLNPSHISIEDFAKPVYAQGASEDDGSNILTIKKIPRSKKLELGFTDSESFFGDAHNTHSGSTRYSGGFTLDFTKYTDQLINRIKQTGAPTDKQQKIIDKINSGFGDIKEIETDIFNLEKEKSDDTYVFVSTQGKSEDEKTEILKKINLHQEIADPTFTEVGTATQFHVSMQNLKPKSNVKISYTISNSNTKEISGVSTSTGTFEFSIPIEATGTQKVNFNINDFQGWVKKDNKTSEKITPEHTDHSTPNITANCDAIKKINGKYRLIYTLPNVKYFPPCKLLPDAPGTPSIFKLPDGKNISQSDNVKFIQGNNPIHPNFIDGTTGKPINTKSMRFVAELEYKSSTIASNEITTENVPPEKVIFDDIDIKDDEINNIKFTYGIGTSGYVATPYKIEIINHFYTEDGEQANDVSTTLATLLQNADNIRTCNNYKNADNDLKQEYDKVITDGKAIYDKLSSTPEQVNDAAQAIQSALSKLNGDSKSKTTLEGLQQEQTKLQRQIEQIKADKNKSEEEKNKEITKLNGQIIDLGKQIEQLNKDKQSLQDQLQQVQNNLSNVTAQFEQFKKDKKTTDEKNQEQISSLNSQIELLNKDKQNLQGEIDTKISQISSLNKQLEQLKQDKTQSEQQKQAEIDKLNGQISQLTKDKQELQSQLNTANNTIQNLNNELEKAKQQHTADTSTIERLTGELQQAKNALEQLKQDKTQSEQQKQAEIDKLNEKITELGKQIEQLTKDKQSLQSQLDVANGKIQTLSNELEKAKQQGIADTSTIQNLNKQVSELQGKLTKLQNDKTLSEQQKQAEIDKFNNEIKDLKKQIEQLTKDKSNLQRQISELNKQIEELTNKVNSCPLVDVEKFKDYERIKYELQQTKQAFEQLKQDKQKSDEEKQEEINQLKKKIEELTQKLTFINSGAIVKPLINEKPEFDLERYKKEHPEEFTTVPSENGELPVEPSTPTVNENNSDGSDTTTTKPNSSTERKKSTITDQENQTEKKSPVATSSTKDKQTLPKTSDPTAPLGLLGFITTALGLFGFKKKH